MFSRVLTFLVIFSSVALGVHSPLASAKAGAEYLVDDAWYQIDSANFHIVTNGDPQAVTTLARDLEKYRAVALSLLGANDDSQKLTIYAAADRDSYAGLVGEDLAEMTNGLFDTTAEGSYALVNLDGRTGARQLQAREFLFHEYTHFLSYNGTTTHYPYWYSEGFAEFMSTMTFKPDGSYEIGAIPKERAATLLFTSPMPLQELLRATVQNTPDEEKGQVYASGWMLAHWLIMNSGKVEEFKNFVTDYNNGADPVGALAKAFGMNVKQIEATYDAQFKRGNFDLATGKVPASFRGSKPKVTRLRASQAVDEVARFLVRSGYNLDGLESLVAHAKRKGIATPELTAIQADAETRIGNYDRAQQLLATVPESKQSQLWFQKVEAWLWLNREINSFGDQRNNPRLKRARDKFVHLVNNNSDQAMNWYGLAMSMEMLGYPRKKYTEMLEQAYLRAPRELHIAQWMAQELYDQKDAEYFAQVAQPLLMELSNDAEYKQMKMMLAEMKPELKPELKSELNSELKSENSQPKAEIGGAAISSQKTKQ